MYKGTGRKKEGRRDKSFCPFEFGNQTKKIVV